MVGALWVLIIVAETRAGVNAAFLQDLGFQIGCIERLTVTRWGKQGPGQRLGRTLRPGRAQARPQLSQKEAISPQGMDLGIFDLGSLYSCFCNLETISTGTMLMQVKRKDIFNKKREKPFESPTISVV